MRRYRKWVLGLGLMAAPGMAAPDTASAGLLDFLGASPAARTAARSQDASAPSNQEMANRIAEALRSARLVGSNIDIVYGGGVCTLTGQVADAEQRARASEWVASVPGVTAVDNRLTLMDSNGSPAAQPMTQMMGVPTSQPAQPVMTADHTDPASGPAGPAGQVVQTAATSMAPVAAPAPSGGSGATLTAYTAEPETDSDADSARAANQQVAEQVGNSLRRARLGDQPITVRFAQGTVILEGSVPTVGHRAMAGRAAGNVAGVTNVENRLSVTGLPVPNAVAYNALAYNAAFNPAAMNAGRVAPVNFQDPGADPSPLAGPNLQGPGLAGPMLAQNGLNGVGDAGAGAGFGAPGMVPGMAPGMAPGMVPGMQPDFGGDFGAQGFGGPQYGVPGPGANPAMFDNPSFPPYAWPAQAQFPNAAAIQYPKQYDASAWPYIGPFYPYPQVPLGWRKVTLEWDDGNWMLDFDSKTDRWWWFVDPKNW